MIFVQGCGFSLWHLEPTMRKNWLSAVMVIAYKYKYGGQHDEASAIVGEKVRSFSFGYCTQLPCRMHYPKEI